MRATYVVIGEGKTKETAMADFYKKAAIRAGKPTLKSDQIHIVEGRYRDDGTYKASFYIGTNGTPQPTAAPGADYTRLEKQAMDNPFR
ncbi:hypothetical protein HYY69_06110 [Candidatus Woesearchaeota archaeon]|nr:hypothetical protein [Candidatus Woesearchaeota archaeon]